MQTRIQYRLARHRRSTPSSPLPRCGGAGLTKPPDTRTYLGKYTPYMYRTRTRQSHPIRSAPTPDDALPYLIQTPTDDVFHWRGTPNHRTKQKQENQKTEAPCQSHILLVRLGKKFSQCQRPLLRMQGPVTKNGEYEVLVMYEPRRLFQRLHVRGRTWDSACPSRYATCPTMPKPGL